MFFSAFNDAPVKIKDYVPVLPGYTGATCT